MSADTDQEHPDQSRPDSSDIGERYTRFEIVAVVALLTLAALVRGWQLEADPPLKLSHSSDVYTDASLYTFYARDYVQTGKFGQIEDERFGIILKSSVTPVAVAVFTIFGVGLWQSNLVGVLFAMGALFCFYLFVRRIAGVAASLWFLLLAGLTYNLIFFDRQPFLERAMTFWGFLSLALVTYGRRLWVFVLAGFVLGVSALFSKILGLIFLFPFACLLSWRWFFGDQRLPKLRTSQVVAYISGFAGAALTWLFVSYLPAPSQIRSFFQENTVGLHGAPRGLQSIGDFLEKCLTFGYDTDLFPRMVVVGLLGAVFVGAVVYQLFRKTSYTHGLRWGNAGYVFLASMVLAFHLSLMIWNYRPLRYQMILVYPFCAGAAILITTLWKGWRNSVGEKVHWAFWPVCALLAVIPSYQIFAGCNELINGDWWASMSRYGVPLSAPIFALIIGLLVSRARTHGLLYRPVPARLLAACLIAGALFGNVKSYLDWAVRPTFTIRDVNRDLALNVSPGALITGPYAQVLTMENSVPALIHMFGTVRPDPDFFKKFPITHLLLDDGNFGWLSKDYPEVMNRNEQIGTYFIGETRVRLVNVAGIADNPVAASYRRSPLEESVIAYRLKDTDRARAAMATFVEQNPISYAGDLQLFEMNYAAGDLDAADTALKKAVEFSPTSYVLKVRLGNFYADLARMLKRPELREFAARYFKEAVDLAPTAERTVDAYRRFLESKE